MDFLKEAELILNTFTSLEDFKEVDPVRSGFDDSYVYELNLSAKKTEALLKGMLAYQQIYEESHESDSEVE